MRLATAGLLACAWTPSTAAAFVLVLPPQTIVIDAPDLGSGPHVRYTAPSIGASASRPWVATEPIALSISEIRFDFDEALPFVRTSPFTVTIGDVHTEAVLPFGVTQSFLVTAFKGEKSGSFSAKVSGITPEPDGSIRLGFDSPDIAQTTTYQTPVGVDLVDGLNIWSLNLTLRNLSHAGAEITLDRVSTIGDGGHIEGDLNGLPLAFQMLSPGELRNVGALSIGPEPAQIDFEIVTSEIVACEGDRLCTHVAARLGGTAPFGSQPFVIPLPTPTDPGWAPRSAMLNFVGAFAAIGSYPTQQIRDRELPGGTTAFMGEFVESARFADGTGAPFATLEAQVVMACDGVPGGYSFPTRQCIEGDPFTRFRAFDVGNLSWTQGGVEVTLDVSGSEPLPIPGTGRVRLDDQLIDILVTYSLDADDDGVLNTTDNCPSAANPDQLDRGGVGGAEPDGIGDACQCGDVTGDGRVTPSDAAQMRRALLVPPTAAMTKPELCDVGGSHGCSTADAAIVLRALLQPPTASLAMHCEASRP